MYTITKAAELVRVTPARLRAWELQYGIVQAHRDEQGTRLYDEDQIDMLRAMAAMVQRGLAPGRAAQLVQQAFARYSADQAAETNRATHEMDRMITEADLVKAAAELEPRTLHQMLGRMLRPEQGIALEQVFDDWLLPQFQRLGWSWEEGQIVVAQEHFVTAAVMRVLTRCFDELEEGDGPVVMMGLPPGSRHELGLLCFAICARLRGLQVVYLGADVPLSTWLEAVRLRRPRAAVTAASMRRDAISAGRVADMLAAQRAEANAGPGGDDGADHGTDVEGQQEEHRIAKVEAGVGAHQLGQPCAQAVPGEQGGDGGQRVEGGGQTVLLAEQGPDALRAWAEPLALGLHRRLRLVDLVKRSPCR